MIAPTGKIQQIQTILGVVADGDWGAKSQAAMNALIHPVTTPSRPIHPFIVAAARWMGIQETTKNRFPGDVAMWADCADYPNGYEDIAPYCAAFQCHVVAEAIRKGALLNGPRPTSASVSEWRAWAKRLGFMVKTPQPGDHFTLLPSGTSHIGLVEKVEGTVLFTMEGNTNAAGARDGDGFWRKTRKVSACDFIRIPLL